MKLQDLEFLNTHTVAAGQAFYRVQRVRASAMTVRRGPLRLAPPGSMSGRFDLANAPTAYLAEAPETALYEAVFRREATSVSLSGLANRALLTAQLAGDLPLGDLRPHASAWPLLQSLRFSETQALANAARTAGFLGLIYRSAQQYAHDAIVLFDPPGTLLRQVAISPLVSPAGAVNRWVAFAAQRSMVPLVP